MYIYSWERTKTETASSSKKLKIFIKDIVSK